MAFEKTWTEEQEKRILELSDLKVSPKEISNELGKTEKAVIQKIYSLKKKIKKSQTKKPKKEKFSEEVQSQDILVAQVPVKEEAEEMQKAYFESDFSNSDASSLENKDFNSQIKMQEKPKLEEMQEVSMDWSVFSNSISSIIDQRFISSKLTPLTDEEKIQFSIALNEVMKRRAKLFGQYADVMALGVTIFSIFTPRLMDFFNRKKIKREKINESANLDLTKSEKIFSQTSLKEEIIDEKLEAEKRYKEMVEVKNQ